MCALASAAARGASAGAWSKACAAYHQSPRVGSTSIAMFASWCFTAWNCASGWPNCWRVWTYATVERTSCMRRAERVGGEQHAARVDEAAQRRCRSRAARPRASVESERGERSAAIERRLGRDRARRRPASTSASAPPAAPTTNRSAPSASGTSCLRPFVRPFASRARHSAGCQRAPSSASATSRAPRPTRAAAATRLLRLAAARASASGSERVAEERAGTAPRPSSSATSARSSSSRPAPPCVSGHDEPGDAELGETLPQRRARAALAVEDRAHRRGGHSFATKPRTVSWSSSCSSESEKSIAAD